MTEIEGTELIDTTENKPKLEQEVEEIEPEELQNKKMVITPKNVSKLTDDEKSYLINLYKNGGEDEHFKVNFYKNGNSKIVKKKQPPQRMSSKFIDQTENNRKTVMTTEQLLMEHVIDLEARFATLHQKHRKLKKYYKNLQEDLYVDDNDDVVERIPVQNNIETPVMERETTYEEPEPEPEQQTVPTTYINRIRRQPKGYRKMMSSMY